MDAEEYTVDSTFYYSGRDRCPVCADHGATGAMDEKGGNNGYGGSTNSECNIQSTMNLTQQQGGSSQLASRHSLKSNGRGGRGGSRLSHHSSVSTVTSQVIPRRNLNSLVHLKKIPEWRKDDSKIKIWCKCGCCETQKRPQDNICCLEFPEAKKKFSELDTFKEGQLTCITKHPAFFSLVLDEWVLQKCWMTHKHKYEEELQKDVKQKERYTEMAVHQFVMWYWGYHDNQVRLPSCVMTSIDNNFATERIRRKSFPKLN